MARRLSRPKRAIAGRAWETLNFVSHSVALKNWARKKYPLISRKFQFFPKNHYFRDFREYDSLMTTILTSPSLKLTVIIRT